MNFPILNAKLEHYTTFRLGGPCRFLYECQTPEELLSIISQLNHEQSPYILIGGGSNLVVSDEGIDCAVIRYASSYPIIERNNTLVTVSGSTSLDALALFCVNEGLEGLSFATGIPGTVGGAVVGNAGAWGKQVGDALDSISVIDKNGTVKEISPQMCAFEYRHSRLKESGDIVLKVTFVLQPGDPHQLAQERADILKKRSEKHPNLNTHPCAGSFFRNVEPTSKAGHRQAAGWFLEEAGGKNLRVGGAQIFEKHANIIVKGQGCTAQDVYEISQEMIQLVRKKFGFDLNREVRFVGKFKTSEKQNNQGFW